MKLKDCRILLRSTNFYCFRNIFWMFRVKFWMKPLFSSSNGSLLYLFVEIYAGIFHFIEISFYSALWIFLSAWIKRSWQKICCTIERCSVPVDNESKKRCFQYDLVISNRAFQVRGVGGKSIYLMAWEGNLPFARDFCFFSCSQSEWVNRHLG